MGFKKHYQPIALIGKLIATLYWDQSTNNDISDKSILGLL